MTCRRGLLIEQNRWVETAVKNLFSNNFNLFSFKFVEIVDIRVIGRGQGWYRTVYKYINKTVKK